MDPTKGMPVEPDGWGRVTFGHYSPEGQVKKSYTLPEHLRYIRIHPNGPHLQGAPSLEGPWEDLDLVKEEPILPPGGTRTVRVIVHEEIE